MKNYKIIFEDGKIEFVSEKEYFQIEKNGIDNPEGSFWLGKNRYLFEDIKRMEAPKSIYPTFDPRKYARNSTPEKRMEAIESMAKGLKKYIESSGNNGTGKPEKLLELFRLCYSRTKNELTKT
jgi:Txe/YoeB family toxin of Txe-Axe toxin-antitoxin module